MHWTNSSRRFHSALFQWPIPINLPFQRLLKTLILILCSIAHPKLGQAVILSSKVVHKHPFRTLLQALIVKQKRSFSGPCYQTLKFAKISGTFLKINVLFGKFHFLLSALRNSLSANKESVGHHHIFSQSHCTALA